jgi:ADP-heptose:LPS heptosyltransferase
MLEKIRFKIGLLYTKFHFRKKIDEVRSFTGFVREDSRALIIMPNDPLQFEEAKSAVLHLKKEWPKLQPILIMRNQFSSFEELRDIYKTITISASDINGFFLPKRKFTREIPDYDYDLVIDFNREINLASSYISKKVNVDYRISFVKEYADKFFNFQFNADSVLHNKNVYSSLMKNLKMFCYKGIQDEIKE